VVPPVGAGYVPHMRRLLCLLGCMVLAGAAVAPVAAAEQRALLDAPRAQDVALAGGEVLVASTTARAGVRVAGVPLAGGAATRRFALPGRGRLWNATLRLVSSEQLAALLVLFEEPEGNLHSARVYAGPPSGPLELVRGVRRGRGVWSPIDIDVDGDRLLVMELDDRGRRVRVNVRAAGMAPVRVA
jgi:hypothetical protein